MAEHECYAFRISVEKDFKDEPEIIRAKLETIKETSLMSGFVGIIPDSERQSFAFLFRTEKDRDVAFSGMQKIFETAKIVQESVVVGSW